MTENLTDEHEALVADVALVFCGGDVPKAARIVEFIAERAKPAPSDEERAQALFAWFTQWVDWSVGKQTPRERILADFASIRAEGSAERAKLEGALKDAAIVARTTPVQTDSSGWYCDGFKDARNYIADRLDDIIRAALAQPAESGESRHAEYFVVGQPAGAKP